MIELSILSTMVYPLSSPTSGPTSGLKSGCACQIAGTVKQPGQIGRNNVGI